MNLNLKNAVGFLTFKKLEEFSFLKHAFSTRLGGISNGNFKSMNLGTKSKDLPENVNKNYNFFCDAVGIPKNLMVFSDQIHSDGIISIHSRDNFPEIKNCDGLITNKSETALATIHADCCPVFILDAHKKVIGLAHAGWRGTVKNIAGKMIAKMKSEFNCNSKDLICCLGPAIGKCCFETGKEVVDEFRKLPSPGLFIKISEKNFYIDLIEANKQNLIRENVQSENIITSDLCTKCCGDLLFSKRSLGKNFGTAVAVFCLIS
jgi:YfiH family protein